MQGTGGLMKFGGVAAWRRHAAGRLILLALGAACAANALAHEGESNGGPDASPTPIDQALQETQQGHGWISIAYLNHLVNGFRFTDSTIRDIGTVRSHSISLDAEYYVTDKWSINVGIPYIMNRYTGNAPHCPTAAPPQCAGKPVLTHPHPESAFLDDGQFHSTWQDWSFGTAYHANIGNYFLTPSMTLHIPSHDYTFFTQTGVGQDLQRVELGATLAHQFDFSQLYYRVGFGRVFSEKTLGQSIDYNKLDLELGYFLNDAWTVKLFSNAKKGNGYRGAYNPTTEVFYHHDQRAPHDYAAAGFGADYHFGDKYILSSSVQREIWGRLIFNFKYAFEMRLTRAF